MLLLTARSVLLFPLSFSFPSRQTDVKLFGKQTATDEVIEDVAAMIGSTRSSLNGQAAAFVSRNLRFVALVPARNRAQISLRACAVLCRAVVASEKGVVVGQIQFKDDGDFIGTRERDSRQHRGQWRALFL